MRNNIMKPFILGKRRELILISGFSLINTIICERII